MRTHLTAGRRLAALISVMLATIAVVSACIGTRPQTCGTHGECAGGICNAQGFCETECSVSKDCPCGSLCRPSCGLCVRVDLAGPATCFAFQRGLNTPGVLGVCRADIPDASPDGADASLAESEAGVCKSELPTLPSCLLSPPAIVAADAATDATPDATEDAGPSDAAVETGGDK